MQTLRNMPQVFNQVCYLTNMWNRVFYWGQQIYLQNSFILLLLLLLLIIIIIITTIWRNSPTSGLGILFSGFETSCFSISSLFRALIRYIWFWATQTMLKETNQHNAQINIYYFTSLHLVSVSVDHLQGACTYRVQLKQYVLTSMI
jgi:hypothetical protein